METIRTFRMNSDQRKVAIDAASGVISMSALVLLLFDVLPSPPDMNGALDRIVFTLRMNVLAILPLFIGIAVVGNSRFMSEAIDPLRHAENRAMKINGRFVDNTLQQNILFFIGTVALSAYLDAQSVKLIAALTIVFIVARTVF